MRRFTTLLLLTMALSLAISASAFGQQGAQSTPTATPPQAAPPAAAVEQKAPVAVQVAPAPYGEIAGSVKSGSIPLPGVTVSAANTLTGKKFITSTDLDGSFKLAVTSKGRYVVRAEFSGFAVVTQEILINDENRVGKAELSMILFSRAQLEEQQRAAQAANAGQQGMQRLSLSGSDLGGVAPASSASADLSTSAMGLPNAGLAAEGNNESVAVSGAMGRNDQPTFDPGEMQDRIAELRDQLMRQGGGSGSISLNGGTVNFNIVGGGGGFGGGGGGGGGPMMIMIGGPGGGGGGRRGGRNFNVNRMHGSIFYNFGGSGLDARPYSLSGQPESKPSYDQNRFGVSIGGPLNIPHIYKGGTKTFLFANYVGSRSTNPYDSFSTVPTLAERGGDFSQLLSQASPVVIRDPVTHTPFTNNMLPSINPAAAALLNFFPTPNNPGVRNFHFVSSNRNNLDSAFVRFTHSFGSQPASLMQAFGGATGGNAGGGRARQAQQNNNQNQKKKSSAKWNQSINGGFNYNNVRNVLLNPYPGLGGDVSVHSYNGNFGYNLGKNLFLNSLRFNYNRSGTSVTNNFTNKTNIAAQAGITGVSQSPSDFGLPNLSFSDFSGLRDTSASFRTAQTFTISDSMNWSHGKHGLSWGGDFRRQSISVSNAANARGSFVFNGAASGFDFADFLLGIAQQTSIQFGASNYQFRSTAYDLFVQDNWRAGKNLTFNLGLRYEYVAPFSEVHNMLVNLDVAPGFTAVTPVQPGQTGALSGTQYSSSLVNPDRNNFAPRVGLAWKLFSKTVVRTGYGINYNLGQYGTLANQMAFQPPFAFTQTNVATLANPLALTLQNGFPASAKAVTNNYAADPNYRLAYVQTWNLNIQQEVKSSVVVNLGYSGSKGTHLDIVRAPSLDANGVLLNNAQPFLFESSQGSSILHSGSLRVRKRMRAGLSLGGNYTYSKSIDNASSIGGGATVVAQNDQNLAAERGLSSFDQRHRFGADYSYELPFGKEKKFLKGDSWAGKALTAVTFSGNVTLASGTPFSPRILGNRADLTRGVNGSLRPDVVAGVSIQGDHSIQQWFNTAAFAAPAGAFGDAGRNIIIGPGTFDVDMAVSKTIQLKDMQGLELRLSANNVFNHVHFTTIDSVLGSPTFGQVVAAGSMRKAQIIARYRF